MIYLRAGTSTSSTSEHAEQVQVSSLAFDTSVRVLSVDTFVRRISYSPQAGHGRPGARFGVAGGVANAGLVSAPLSNAAMRASSASIRSGPALMRDHSLHLSKVDRSVGNTAPNAGRPMFSPRDLMRADGYRLNAKRQHDASFIRKIAA